MLVACSRKRDRCGRQAGSPPTVYFVYYHPYSDLYAYSFYAVEVAGVENDQVKPLPEPLFRFKEKTSPVAPGFVALNSKIYVVGGKTPPRSGKEIYVFDTYVFDTAKSLPTHSKTDDPTEFLVKGPRLNAPKFGPILVTFEGKIYAFPRLFSSHSPPSPKCEMLDVEVGSWIPLPDPPLLDHNQKDRILTNYTVQSYVVHDGSFVASTRYGMYSLDLSNPTEWRHIPILGGMSRLPFIREAICINEEYFAIVIGRHMFDETLYKYRKGWAEKKEILNLESGYEHLICYRHDRVIHFGDNLLCVIRCGLDRHPESYPPDGSQNFLCFEIFQVSEHQKKKKKKKKNQSGLARLASSRFLMDNSQGSYGFLMGGFPKKGEV